MLTRGTSSFSFASLFRTNDAPQEREEEKRNVCLFSAERMINLATHPLESEKIVLAIMSHPTEIFLQRNQRRRIDPDPC